MATGNVENLRPVRTKEEARERGRKGGIKSGEVRNKKKTMKEQMEILLSSQFKDSDTIEKFKEKGFKTDNMDNQMALMVAMYLKAINGDTSAMNIVREIMGERVQQISIDTSVDEKVKELSIILDDIE